MFEDVSRWPSGRRTQRRAIRPRVAGMALKRGLDVTIAFLALVALFPSLLIVRFILRHALVKIPTRGRNGRIFGRFNFAFEGAGGRAMREAGIDRLPELINVLKGDMSLIGPPPGSDGVPTARPGMAALPEPARTETAPPFANLRMLISILRGGRG